MVKVTVVVIECDVKKKNNQKDHSKIEACKYPYVGERS